jgi:hypothetical protein
MLSSSPIEAGTSPDWHLAGLLTYASTNLNSLPKKILGGWSLAPCSVLSEYSYGVVADSNRASRHQMEQLINIGEVEVKPFGGWVMSEMCVGGK